MKKTILLLFIIIGSINQIIAQNIGLGTTTPDPSAEFEIQSTDKGLLTPRMTTEQREAIPNPAEGLVVYDTDQQNFWLFKKNAWGQIFSSEEQILPQSSPTTLSSTIVGGGLREIVTRDNLVYIIDGGGNNLKIVDVSNPNAPMIIGVYNGFGDLPQDLALQNNHVFALDLDFGLLVINISDPTTPILTASLNLGFGANQIDIKDNVAYVAGINPHGLKIIDISMPSSPNIIGTYNFTNTPSPRPSEVVVKGNTVFVIDWNGNDLQAIDVSNPTAPSLLDEIWIGHYPRDMVIIDNYVYIVDKQSDYLRIIDISNPSSLNILSTLNLGPAPHGISIQNDFAYVADSSSNDVKIINISDPSYPIVIDSFGINHSPENILVKENYAYIISTATNDLKIIQLSELNLLGVDLMGNTISVSTPWNDVANNINTSNNVGIGTSEISSADPDIKLDIQDGHIAVSNGFGVFATSTNNTYLASGFDTDNEDFMIYAGGSTKMRINANGTTGIGRTAVTSRLEIEGDASKTSAGDWEANSDFRLKKNIQLLSSELILEKMLSLRGVRYEWNDNQTGTLRPDGFQFGFIAQNIQQYFPELVTEDNNGFLQTAYGTYDAIQLEALRALNDEIELLEKDKEDLKTKIQTLKEAVLENPKK